MNARERFLAIAHFEKPDKVPVTGGARRATLERWWKEGLPRDVSVADYFGLDTGGEGLTTFIGEGFSGDTVSPNRVNIGPVPPFEEKVLEQSERHRVWIDGLGIKQKGFKADWEDGWMGFATRTFLEFPVKTREDFLKMKERYDPYTPSRYPKQWEELKRRWRKRDYPLVFSLRGPFWWTRDMMGLEAMLLNFFLNPDLIHDIMRLCADFHVKMLHKALDEINPPPDHAGFSEDMAYKWGPMISPKMVREFMLSPYKKMTRFLRSHGVDIISVDSDGNPSSLIPVYLEAGINGITPCEIAAGMDPVALRKQYPHLIMWGGIDKRVLARDKKAIEREVISKVPYLIKTGGYFPGVDHAVPADVPLENYGHFINILKKVCSKKL